MRDLSTRMIEAVLDGEGLRGVAELAAADPQVSEDRERLGLGIKAYRILAPALPR